ncbi:DNA polymerase III beta subunit-like protein [Actinocorallia herbida]|uniref:DNA polymerase III beta subunit-like protein n=1 Tax=Actinocorallia herbida TaxID=58109 RepID=A0A3N1D0B4_9ACTN|nr:MerR family transcriptional regulator [Actinocorallia herbida]ROO86478.1 DNA polymerase III beta subunit-like protein [Actinocorallia herbida]
MHPMNHHDDLMSIGTFARAVGLTPSALRFYDDCGALTPAHVDPATGYRYYSTRQETRARTLRRLRDAQIPLTDATAILDGTPDTARTLLHHHAHRARTTAQATQNAIDDLLAEHTPHPAHSARLDGAALASAVRQVAPATATGPTRDAHPALGAILLEIDTTEIRLAATDRYRLAVRALPATLHHGEPHTLLIPVEALQTAAAWALHHPHIDLDTDQTGSRLRHHDHTHPLPTLHTTFPDYRRILDDLPTPRQRLITDRAALQAALTTAHGPVTFHTAPDHLTLTSPDTPDHTQPALCTGPPTRLSFDPTVLLPALDTGLGPDTLLEITAPDLPVIVRSADQGSFTTLVMPVRA